MGVLRVAIALWGLLAASAAAGPLDPRLEVSKWSREVLPGDHIYVDGYHWFSLIAPNCDGSVRLKLTDAEGTRWGLGRLDGQTGMELLVDYEGEQLGDMTGRLRIPEGVAPGPARIRAKQYLRLRIPPLSCSQIQLATKSATARITVLGAVGNSPPRLAGLSAAPVRQGAPTPISWTASEPGSTTIRLAYEFVAGRWIDLGVLAMVPTVAGANAFAWDGSLGGHFLPAGGYRVELQQTGDAGELSAPARLGLSVVYG